MSVRVLQMRSLPKHQIRQPSSGWAHYGPLRSLLCSILVLSFASPALGDVNSTPAGSEPGPEQYGPPLPPSHEARTAHGKHELDTDPARTNPALDADAGAPAADAATPTATATASSAPATTSAVPSLTASAPPSSASSAPSVVPSAPSAATSAGASDDHPAAGKAEPKLAKVTLGDRTVFTLGAARGSKSAEERAKNASHILAKILEKQTEGEVHAVEQGSGMLVVLGETTIVALNAEDARIAGEESVDSYAQTVVSAVSDAIDSERQRGKIDKRVFSASLVVFFGLIAFYLLRKTSEWAESAREWLEERGDTLSIRVRQMEIVAPEVVETAALFALGALKWFVRVGILYAWLLVALSLFESTRGYTQRLTGWVLAPLTELTERIASTLPVLVVAALALIAIWVLLRFVQLLFEAVARRETTLAWVPPDLARPTSVLVRLGIVLAALIFAAPIVTGNSDGPLARTGLLALMSLGLAATPLVSSALVGGINVFARRLRVGEHVEVRGRRGRVSKLGLFELCLELEDQSELRMPYVVLTWSSLRLLGTAPVLEVELAIAASANIVECEAALLAAASDGFSHAKVGLTRADGRALHFSVSARAQRLSQQPELLKKLVERLRAAGIQLGASDSHASELRR